MKIQTLHFLEGASQAAGTAVVIDVFRAFSTACFIAANKAQKIITVEHLEEALNLKSIHPEYILIGERGGKIPEGFDYGNSPSCIEHADFSGKTVVLTTSAGTRGLFETAKHADTVLTGAFVNASATARWILNNNSEEVSLVCMGWNAREPADEDTLFAEYLESLLTGRERPFAPLADYLIHERKTGSFLDLHDEASAPKKDLDLCLELDRFSFILQAQDNVLIPYPVPRLE